MDRAGAEIELASEGGGLRAYLAVPASGSGPGALAIGAGGRLDEHARAVCDRLAREGFAALAPDLAGLLGDGGDLARARAELDAALEGLLRCSAVDGPRVGAVGFAEGGGLALDAASRHPRLAAVVDFGGRAPDPDFDARSLRAAVFAVFPGDADPWVAELREGLAAAGVRAAVRLRPELEPGFMDPGRPDAYDAAAADEGWRDLVAFLRAELS